MGFTAQYFIIQCERLFLNLQAINHVGLQRWYWNRSMGKSFDIPKIIRRKWTCSENFALQQVTYDHETSIFPCQ
jgi:hypothetical protein